MRYVFDSTPDCEVIHGALYSCLRAMFGLSVSGILVCIFSCMLVYQLLRYFFQYLTVNICENTQIAVTKRKKCTGSSWSCAVGLSISSNLQYLLQALKVRLEVLQYPQRPTAAVARSAGIPQHR